jgi:hypothetical protein
MVTDISSDNAHSWVSSEAIMARLRYPLVSRTVAKALLIIGKKRSLRAIYE